MIGSLPRRMQEVNEKLKILNLPEVKLPSNPELTELDQIRKSNKRKYFEDMEVSIYTAIMCFIVKWTNWIKLIL